MRPCGQLEKAPDFCYNNVMSKTHPTHRHSALELFTLVLIIACLAVAGITYIGGWDSMSARILPKPTPKWLLIDQADVASGALIPSDTNVIFHVPDSVTEITREVLFGQKGEFIRYWGYCFDENDEPSVVETRIGSKRLLFLSEKERAVRAERERAAQPTLSPFTPPTKANLRRLNQPAAKGTIRHQVEVFRGNQMCYIMTEDNLAIGTDTDGDKLNLKLEQEIDTDPETADTDGDFIPDGVEYEMHSNPLIRDSDSDGMIDGLEDVNLNGRVDFGETSPIERDTDKDGLCDGQCRILLPNRRTMYAGEDENLNGKVDAGESDPRKKDSDGDGITDYEELIQCLSEEETSC